MYKDEKKLLDEIQGRRAMELLRKIFPEENKQITAIEYEEEYRKGNIIGEYHELHLLEEYLLSMEIFIEKEVNKRKNIANKLLKKYPGSETGKFVNYYVDDAEVSFANLLRKSLFVSAYSYFESKLIEYCKLIQSTKINLSYSDIRGQSEIDRAKFYLTKVINVDFPGNSKEWNEIQNYRLLRNNIVHTGGIMELDNYLKEYIHKNKSVLTINENQIFIKPGFCENAISVIKTFLETLQKRLFDDWRNNKDNITNGVIISYNEPT